MLKVFSSKLFIMSTVYKKQVMAVKTTIMEEHQEQHWNNTFVVEEKKKNSIVERECLGSLNTHFI